jgi:hypothetical protein
MIYRYSENGLESVMLFEEDDGVRVGVAHPDGTFTCHLSKTTARALVKRIVELVGDEPISKPKIKTFEKRQIVFFLSSGERLSVIGEYGTCIPDANMGECRINDIEGNTLLVKCSEVIAIQDFLCPIEEDQEDE